MQDFKVTFRSIRNRKRSDDTALRDQLKFIGDSAVLRGWGSEVGPIDASEHFKAERHYWEIVSSIRFYRTREIDAIRFQSQAVEIYESAAAKGNHVSFSKPWVADPPDEIKNFTRIVEEMGNEDGEPSKPFVSDSDSDVIQLQSLGNLRPEKFYGHLFDLDAQISVLISSLQAAIDSNMGNRFHSLLFGAPGCGKSDMLASTNCLLRSHGVLTLMLDATSTTEAGVRKDLMDESNITPQVIFIEEIEKTPENALRWLLGVTDDRGILMQTNFRRSASREVKAVVLATANDYDLFKRMMSGALLSRFSNEIYCPRPTRETLVKFLHREISKLDGKGNFDWIEPALTFAFDENNITDPRVIKRICLCGKGGLLTGEYQEYLQKTMRLGSKKRSANQFEELI